jgi:hypothetical protein
MRRTLPGERVCSFTWMCACTLSGVRAERRILPRSQSGYLRHHRDTARGAGAGLGPTVAVPQPTAAGYGMYRRLGFVECCTWGSTCGERVAGDGDGRVLTLLYLGQEGNTRTVTTPEVRYRRLSDFPQP